MTGEELASVTDTQKDGLEQAVQAASAAFPIWSSKTWNERSVLLANALEELKAHTDELRTILTAENGRPYRVAQWEIIRLFDTYVPTLPRVELQDLTWNEPGDPRSTPLPPNASSERQCAVSLRSAPFAPSGNQWYA